MGVTCVSIIVHYVHTVTRIPTLFAVTILHADTTVRQWFCGGMGTHGMLAGGDK